MDMDETCNLFQGNQVANELEAYLLGFFYADGSVSCFRSSAYRVFSIALAAKDREYLQWIANVINQYLNTDYKLKYNADTQSYKLCVAKKDFISNIIKLGIVYHKTYENNDFVFKNVPDELKWHFIRGYFDGDGSICCDKTGKHIINIVSLNHKLIKSIYDYCRIYLSRGSIRKDKKYYRFCLSGNPSILHFGEYLYKDACYFMDRKKIKFDNVTVYHKNNIYAGILPYRNKYKVSIWNKHTKQRIYLGLRETVREAIELYNDHCESCCQVKQQYKGEELYYE